MQTVCVLLLQKIISGTCVYEELANRFTKDIGKRKISLYFSQELLSKPPSYTSTMASKSASTRNNLNDNGYIIGTHDGIFHCDEALGCFMLRILHPEAKIIRSRDLKVLKDCDTLIDVGGVYDPERNQFDHHQKTFTHSMNTLSSEIKSDVKLSSAGLIYHHFGKDILKKIIGNEDENLINYIYRKLYCSLIQEIDGVDNGIPAFPAEPRYNICTGVDIRIQRLNKSWNVPDTEYDAMLHFEKAIDLVGEEFVVNVNIVKNIKYPARAVVLEAIQNRYNVHESGEIMELKQQCPWKDHCFDLEEELDIKSQIKYVLYFAKDSYRVQAVPVNQTSFVCRKFLVEKWRGLKNEELSQVAGIDGCVFVHSNGFIGGNVNRAGALEMAKKSLKADIEHRTGSENNSK